MNDAPRTPTPSGTAWLASAGTFPGSVTTLWSRHPHRATELPCGRVFDVVSAPALFGRRLLEALWTCGPGSGPVAAHRGRLLLFAAPGTAARLPALLHWQEWSGGAAPVPALLCLGTGDVVSVPGPVPAGRESEHARWLVAPHTPSPWLPGPDVLLWGCVRASRAGRRGAGRNPVFAGA
ncbi:bifunctional DNA primase/polymerase [Streptomyces sp. ACA25]|uniref:bifunctional DNA primase/polymerase n=1 Tax=Streptomyces sp. ACA25 TaxID=3022596 RepID=UPI0023071DAD|nr:bifunctional DNA primase/polymerase [Streptomyces sp. ACA25]MDB1089593.1 bifunctional DNA primase/polymerase [Streptomyces sp. ACA25]